MIPKIIHYCWFGRGPMPELAVKCIESWHKYLPGYEYRLWNEDTFDVNSVPYVKEAYEARKYAFVTDYVRLWALKEYGGVYMDTDVEILKPLDNLLELPAFAGFEKSKLGAPGTCIIATSPYGVWVQEQLDSYENRHFRKEDGTLDMTTNTVFISNNMVKNGFILNGKYQVYKGDLHVFPADFFCPLSSTRVLRITSNTYCIHHFAGSWKDLTMMDKCKDFITAKILGPKITNALIAIKRKIQK